MGKLDDKSIEQMRRRLVARESTASIAADFGVSTVTVRKIRRRLVDGTPLQGQRGDKNGRSKLTYKVVKSIKDQVSSGSTTQAALAKKFNVSRSLISRICKGERWSKSDADINSVHFLKMDLRNHRPERGSLEENELVDTVFTYYRMKGYPYRTFLPHRVGHALKALAAGPSVIEGRRLKLSSRGLKLANAFHPHMDSVRCRNTRTPVEVFGDDNLLRKSILKHIRYGHHLTPQGIRYAVYHYGGAQWASNFRPAVVRSPVELLGGKRVLDPCMGFGGRLLGTISAGRDYVGIDPAKRTVDGNQRMVRTIHQAGIETPPVLLLQECAEDILGRGHFGRFDLAITSPPYFNVEIYDASPSQSSARYPEFGPWLNYFLKPLIAKTSADLKLYGYMALNIARNLLPYVRDVGVKIGLREVTVFDYELYVRQVKQLKQGRTRSEPLILMERLR